MWGRRAAVDLPAVERVVSPAQPVVLHMPEKLDKLIERRANFLTAYQNEAYAQRYRALVERVRAAATKVGLDDVLPRSVAQNLFKLMAYKDEYEVARLYSDPAFEEALRNTFEGEFSVRFNLAPPLLAKRDVSGRLIKSEFGSWMKIAFRVLSRMKRLRNTVFDPFGYTEERRAERRLVRDYETALEECLNWLSEDNARLVLSLASLPEKVRGFGHVKAANIAAFDADRKALLQRLRLARLPQAA